MKTMYRNINETNITAITYHFRQQFITMFPQKLLKIKKQSLNNTNP